MNMDYLSIYLAVWFYLLELCRFTLIDHVYILLDLYLSVKFRRVPV